MIDAKLKMDESDRIRTVEKYRKGYVDYGYSPKALGWDKGRQDIRFEVLLSFFECHGKSILDIGCGFGDLNRVLSRKSCDSYDYLGVDLVSELIEEGQRHYQQKNIRFLSADFLEYQFTENFDIVVGSGIFNHKFSSGGNDLFVDRVLRKAWSLCIEGFAFDFLSDKVDYRHNHTYHNNPERILGLAYELSRKVCLKNDYMPFEFCLYVGKDDTFDPAHPVFKSYGHRDVPT
jgi:SAM-dependent methyltransferase